MKLKSFILLIIFISDVILLSAIPVSGLAAQTSNNRILPKGLCVLHVNNVNALAEDVSAFVNSVIGNDVCSGSAAQMVRIQLGMMLGLADMDSPISLVLYDDSETDVHTNTEASCRNITDSFCHPFAIVMSTKFTADEYLKSQGGTADGTKIVPISANYGIPRIAWGTVVNGRAIIGTSETAVKKAAGSADALDAFFAGVPKSALCFKTAGDFLAGVYANLNKNEAAEQMLHEIENAAFFMTCGSNGVSIKYTFDMKHDGEAIRRIRSAADLEAIKFPDAPLRPLFYEAMSFPEYNYSEESKEELAAAVDVIAAACPLFSNVNKEQFCSVMAKLFDLAAATESMASYAAMDASGHFNFKSVSALRSKNAAGKINTENLTADLAEILVAAGVPENLVSAADRTLTVKIPDSPKCGDSANPPPFDTIFKAFGGAAARLAIKDNSIDFAFGPETNAMEYSETGWKRIFRDFRKHAEAPAAAKLLNVRFADFGGLRKLFADMNDEYAETVKSKLPALSAAASGIPSKSSKILSTVYEEGDRCVISVHADSDAITLICALVMFVLLPCL